MKHLVKINSYKPEFSEADRITILTDWLQAYEIEYEIEITHATTTGNQYIFWSHEITIDFINDEDYALFLLMNFDSS